MQGTSCRKLLRYSEKFERIEAFLKETSQRKKAHCEFIKNGKRLY